MSDARLIWLHARMIEHRDAGAAMSGMQIAVMAVLLAHDAQGLAAITKAEIGALIGVKERQVANILKELEGVLALIQTRRDGGAGKGRAPNRYLIRPDATGNPVPATWRIQQSSASNPVPANLSNQHLTAGSEAGNQQPSADLACGKHPERVIEHVGARAEPLPNNTTYPVLYPEKVEVVLNGSARAMPAHELAAIIFERVNSPWLDPDRSQTLARSVGKIKRWQEAGCDFDEDILPTIVRLMRGKREAVRSLGYFEDAIRQAAAQRMAADAPIKPVSADEASNGQRTGAARAAGHHAGVSGESFTDFMRRQCAPGEPIDYGRVDSIPID